MSDELKEMERLSGINIDKITVKVFHKNLKKIDDSEWRRMCPECKMGILLVSRDLDTFKLQEKDNCILCGQRVEYLDIEEMRQKDGM